MNNNVPKMRVNTSERVPYLMKPVLRYTRSVFSRRVFFQTQVICIHSVDRGRIRRNRILQTARGGRRGGGVGCQC